MKRKVLSFVLMLAFLVFMGSLLNFISINNAYAEGEKSLRSVSEDTLFKVSPGKTFVKIGKSKRFYVKEKRGGKLFRVKGGLIWSVNDVEGGNNTYGTINENGVYRAPKRVPKPNPIRISVKGLDGDYDIKPAHIVIIKKLTKGKLALKAKWVRRNRLAALQDEIPEEVESVRGKAVNDLLGLSFSAGPVDVAKRGLVFPNVPLEGTYTVTLEGLDATGEVVYSGILTGVTATPLNQTPEPATIFLTIINGEVEVSISPEITDILVEAEQQFEASVTGAFDPTGNPVEWSVEGGSSFGTITSDGLYTAPSEVPASSTVTVRATSTADPSVFSEITFDILEVTINVSPQTATLISGDTIQFEAPVTGTNNTSAIWYVNDILGGDLTNGIIDFNGLYTAPTVLAATTVTVKAISSADTTKSATATVTVGPLVSITVSPSTASVASGSTVQFTATVTGASDTSVTWSVDGGSANGTISTTGLYTAPTVSDTTTVTVRATSNVDTTKSATATVTVAIGSIFGKVTKVVTHGAIEGAEVKVGVSGSTSAIKATTTDSSGNYTIKVPPGKYDVSISKDSYNTFTSSVTIVSYESVLLDATLSSKTSTVSVGSVSGKVTDNSAQPIKGAIVQIDGGTQTNGIFATAITDSNGSYTIDSIPTKDTTAAHKPIPSFTMIAKKDGFGISKKTGVVVEENTNKANIDFTLSPEESKNIIFVDDFETDKGWRVTGSAGSGFWHRIKNGTGIKNRLVPNYVTLPPDDGSNGAIPDAFKGEWAYWYGQNETGSYIGEQDTDDTLKSGGTSATASGNFGTLTSPAINLTGATNPVLRFWSWWEIEAVNPNESGYDRIIVSVSTDGGETFTEIKKLNPYADPPVVTGESVKDKPYTSAGFFKAPIWSFYEINLSTYIGRTIILQFEFDTIDAKYNGFRGWFIDDLKVGEQ